MIQQDTNVYLGIATPTHAMVKDTQQIYRKEVYCHKYCTLTLEWVKIVDNEVQEPFHVQ
jgi:hypothetical protein